MGNNAMKQSMIIALALVASAFSYSYAFGAKKKGVKKATTTEQPVRLATPSDTLSYAAGMSTTRGLDVYLKQQGLDTAYIDEFYRGFNAIRYTGGDPKVRNYAIGMDIASQVRNRILPSMKKDFTDTPDSVVEEAYYGGFFAALRKDTTMFTPKNAEEQFRKRNEANRKAKEEKLYGPNRDAGEKFLAENAKKDSVVTLPSGLQYKELVKGSGEVPQKDDKVLVNYEGRLIDGTVFDSSNKRGDKPAEFKPTQVIKGWTEALTMMPVGSKWQLYIPYQLAYGNRDMGNIKPYSTLIFDVELVGIDKPQPAAKDTEKKAADGKKKKKDKK